MLVTFPAVRRVFYADASVLNSVDGYQSIILIVPLYCKIDNLLNVFVVIRVIIFL